MCTNSRMSYFLVTLGLSLLIFSLVRVDGASYSKLIRPFPKDVINLSSDGEDPFFEINVAVLLPVDPAYGASMRRTGPAIILGFEKVKELQLLPDYKVNLHYSDSKCSNVEAPMEAMKHFMYGNTAHIFFGPSCELAVGKII